MLLNESFVSVCTADGGLIPPIVKLICCESILDSILFTPEMLMMLF